MRKLTHLQIDQHKALEDIIVKHKVDEKVLTIQRKLLLSCYKGEASSQLQQEVLQVINQCLLQFSLIHMRIRLDLQKLHYIGVFDDLFIFRFRLRCLYLSSNKRFILACQDSLIVHRVNLPFKLPDAPCGLRTFFRIEGSFFLIGNAHQ